MSTIAVILNGYTANALRGLSQEVLVKEIAEAQEEGRLYPFLYNCIFDTPCVFNKNSSRVGSSEIIPKYKGDSLTNYLKNNFDKKVEPCNPVVNNYAIEIVGDHSGNLTIDQICVIYDFLLHGRDSINGWSYVKDPHGSELIRYANCPHSSSP